MDSNTITISDYFGKAQIRREELINDDFFQWFLEENNIDLKTEENLSKIILDFADNNNFEENLKQYVLEQEHFEPYYLGFSNDESQWREEHEDLEYNVHKFETPSGATWFLGCGFSAIEDVYPPKITKNIGELNSLMETIKKLRL